VNGANPTPPLTTCLVYNNLESDRRKTSSPRTETEADLNKEEWEAIHFLRKIRSAAMKRLGINHLRHLAKAETKRNDT
jgi:hypothetical protein